MKKYSWQIGLAAAVVILAMLACSFSASTANIQNARMARDEAGNDPTTVFAPTDVFHCVGELKNAPDDTKIKAAWIAVQVEGVEPDFLIGEKELTSGSSTFHFQLSNDNPWPAGKYKVELYLNGELDTTLEFEVR
ncbi:MAG TPA: hypothetical protein ENJ31_06685 [Anaerolineae bacterium]|nr:hypothetical protein [Anaerolineae bacterium]